MTSSSRKNASKSQGRDSSAQPTPQSAAKNERIGDILCRVREHRQEDLQSIAEYLCIRQTYLYALEQSHYGALPAEAYVIGFLRTYALYLGLDGQGAIEQYRREMAGHSRSPHLSMPQPMPEGRAPTIAILAGAAVAAIILYGLWYGLSTPDEAKKQPVPLPTTTEIHPPQTISLQNNQSKKNNDSKEETVTSLLQDTTSPGITLSVKGTDETALPPEAAKKMGVLVITAKDKKKDIKKKTQPPAEKDQNEINRSFGYKGNARVALQATKKTWILVTDQKGLTIFDRTLQKGQKYNVQDKRGLRLTTGNAKGLSFLVDGKILPQLKTNKRVVRAIDLGPDALRNLLD